MASGANWHVVEFVITDIRAVATSMLTDHASTPGSAESVAVAERLSRLNAKLTHAIKRVQTGIDQLHWSRERAMDAPRERRYRLLQSINDQEANLRRILQLAGSTRSLLEHRLNLTIDPWYAIGHVLEPHVMDHEGNLIKAVLQQKHDHNDTSAPPSGAAKDLLGLAIIVAATISLLKSKPSHESSKAGTTWTNR